MTAGKIVQGLLCRVERPIEVVVVQPQHPAAVGEDNAERAGARLVVEGIGHGSNLPPESQVCWTLARAVIVIAAFLLGALLTVYVVDVIVDHRKEHGHDVAVATSEMESPDGDEADRVRSVAGVHGPHCVTTIMVRA